MLFSWPMLGVRPRLHEMAAWLSLAGIAVLFAGHQFALGAGKLTALRCAFGRDHVCARQRADKDPLPIAPMAQVAWQVGLGCAPM